MRLELVAHAARDLSRLAGGGFSIARDRDNWSVFLQDFLGLGLGGVLLVGLRVDAVCEALKSRAGIWAATGRHEGLFA